ncbi:YitT family protein [Nocardioides sp. DS6]|uniref:YitT family protein n=1 Tax=Nocardioides eburneus TaxID=3231482 RepID=A0ABV3T688_9ACTN
MSVTMVRRLVWLLVGLVLYGIAIAAMVRASIGISPWDVLTQGSSRTTGLSFGLMTNLIGLVVLLFWLPLRQRPGLGTVLNVLVIGPAAEVGLHVIPQPDHLVLRVALFAGGLLLLACATGIYIAPHLGPGPRDGLMTGLRLRTGAPIWVIRGGIEIVVLVVGYLLGGQVGPGTLAEALLIGPLVHRTLPFFERAYGARPVLAPASEPPAMPTAAAAPAGD